MSAPPEKGWTLSAWIAHQQALREADQQLQKERDRRYAEVQIEREKALTIKEAADRRALELSAETQKYKDEKANELRSQINSERGTYATHGQLIAAVDKIAAEMKPMSVYLNAQQGGPRNITTGTIVAIVGFVVSLLSMVSIGVALFALLRK